MEKKTAIIVSGYFNPLHKGHLDYFEQAKKLGNELWVIVNNDQQRELKGSKQFQDEDERLRIIRALKIVDFAYLSIDTDRTVQKTLEFLHFQHYKDYTLKFANGGDQTNESIPEANMCKMMGIELIDGLGEKVQSSSWLLSK